MSNLYHVQDSDRPMYVVADGWQDAVDRWRAQIAAENPDSDCSEDQPDGVTLVAKGGGDYPGLLLPEDAEREAMCEVCGQREWQHKTEDDVFLCAQCLPEPEPEASQP